MTLRMPGLALAVLLAFSGTARAQTEVQVTIPPAWMNAGLSPDARADLVLAQMNQDEELTLVHGYFGVYTPGPKAQPAAIRADLPTSAGYVQGIARLGIPGLRESDASLGVANLFHTRAGDTATALPSSLLTAASWNTDLAYASGAMIGAEARDKGFNVLLAGGVDLARDPRGGRNFEYAGEDPLLAGVMAGQSIRGIQDQHILSTTKHFALNDQETGRTLVSSDIGEGAMRESDLLAFEIAIETGHPAAVMCAYNRVNSVYACENDDLLNKALKQDWGYPGFVLSDWGAVHSTVDAANNGLDQESANSFDAADYFGDALKQAIVAGKVSTARLHDMAHRILRSMFAVGLIDNPVYQKAYDPVADALVAQRSAEEGIVLLKNSGAILPLAATARHIMLIGGHADTGVMSGGGSSQVIPVGNIPSQEIAVPGIGEKVVLDPPAPLAALKAQLPNTDIAYDDGSDLARAAAQAKAADVAIVFVQQWNAESIDVRDLSLPANQDALVAAVENANPHTIVILETGGPVLMPWLAKAQAVLEAWYPGENGANAIARILTGAVNPSGRLPMTFPQSESQLPRPALPGADIKQSAASPVLFDADYNIEGANVGYKWFAAQKLQPLFPFGFGLTYSSFAYSGLKAVGGAGVTVSFDLRNTSTREGKETAQIYVTPPGGVPRLVGWSKVDLRPGETRHINIATDPRLLASFDEAAHLWRIADGNYAVALGASFAETRASVTVHVNAATIKP
ncbi:MAG TPA: beta-glucosidase [Rhizomicrobium sp.]